MQGGGADTLDNPIKNMEDVTREVAEDYARYIYKQKTTAPKDIATLRRIWDTMLPDLDKNPWKLGLHLRPMQPQKPSNYRPLSVDEARRFVREARKSARLAEFGTDAGDGRYTTGAEKFNDLADAAIFAWHYGLRMGSIANLNWQEMETWRKGYFLHIPPKTKYKKPWPLELPVVDEVRKILEDREKAVKSSRKGTGLLTPVFPALSEEHRRSAQNLAVSVKCIFRRAGITDDRHGRAQMHSFRASFVTMMDEAGAPRGVTDSVTGHAPRTVHDMYSHPRPAAIKKWLDKAIPNLNE